MRISDWSSDVCSSDLLLVDIQNGFCPGGNLPVPDGDKVVPVTNRLIEEGGYDVIVASQDWQPADHGRFASQHPGRQAFENGELSRTTPVSCPDHCQQTTHDGALTPALLHATHTYPHAKQCASNK